MIFFSIISLIIIITLVLLFFTEIKVEIKKLEFKIKNFDINKSGIIIIKFKILNKINLIKIETDIDKIQRLTSKNK